MLNIDTGTLDFFIYAFFVLAGVTAALTVAALVWLVATRQAGSTAAHRAVTPTHELVGVEAEELPQTA